MLPCSEALGLVLRKWRDEMSAHVASKVGDAAGAAVEKFVPRTNNDKAEHEAWLQRQQAKQKDQGGRGTMFDDELP